MEQFDIEKAVTAAMDAPAPRRWDDFLFDYSQPIVEEPAIAWIDGIGILYREGPTIISGPKKAGKTSFVRLLLAAILSGEDILGITAEKELKAVIFDTEQPPFRILNYLDKAFKMANKDRVLGDKLKVYRLREASIEARLQIICEAIEDNQPDIAIVDGIADLVVDINNMETAQRIIDELLRVSDETGTALVLVIHTNPTSPEGKSRGNLGTIAENKAECSILISKSGDIFTVSCKDARGRTFPSFSYSKTKDDDIIQVTTQEKPVAAKDRIFAAMEPGKVYTHSELVGLLGEGSEGTAKSAINDLCRNGRIIKTGRGCYTLKLDDS